MPFTAFNTVQSEIRQKITQHYRADEFPYVEQLVKAAALDDAMLSQIQQQAHTLATQARQQPATSYIERFLQQYALSTEEGVALMCLAESLLRIPDTSTINALIKDKLSVANWQARLGQSASTFVNAATWGLMISGKLLTPSSSKQWRHVLQGLFARTSAPVIRRAVFHAMKIMSKQFVMGETIEAAIKRAKEFEQQGYAYSYDMLGEAAMTAADASTYLAAYEYAIDAIGHGSAGKGEVRHKPGVSIKLSALYPRYHVSQHDKAVEVLSQRLLRLCEKAKHYDIGLTVDAEEADRLDLSLDIMERVMQADTIRSWQGLGLAVQSYQKRALWVLDWAADQAQRYQRRLMIRLIKGAYWDAEIKHAQMEGFSDYPVFTFKAFTDVSFQACVKKLLSYKTHLYPQFATHNVYSVAMILSLVGEYRDFEFQCLHGMGQALYTQVVAQGYLCRVYAPVGAYDDLLPYLVRRLLENGANTSFVNRINDPEVPLSLLLAEPTEKASRILREGRRCLPLPAELYGEPRMNSHGFDVSDYSALQSLVEQMQGWYSHQWSAKPLVVQSLPSPEYVPVYAPAENQREIGRVVFTPPMVIERVLLDAREGFKQWHRMPVQSRASCLQALATLLQANREQLYALLMLEAGKVLQDAINEVREAIDFCRYYAMIACEQLAEPLLLHGYTGEQNTLEYVGRGVMICISPWNFPLAIFLGQIVASLVAGNAVVAKPAEQTSLLAYTVGKLIHQAGVPQTVFQCCPGEGHTVGQTLVSSPLIDGVLFTGGTETAKAINRTLANRPGPIVPLIAETGGQNAMIIDSTALPEQVTQDVLLSSFGSAGQRCSALRVLFIQDDVFERQMEMITGAMAELVVGLPQDLTTDIGPVIDTDAQQALFTHKTNMQAQYGCLFDCRLPDNLPGYFVSPAVYQIPSMSVLEREHFGPVLHVVSYARRHLDQVINQINQSGYGLTFGLHSRLAESVDDITSRVSAGNCYVNRNTIGAVVGLQPFGGQGLSGTGPKAGGPNYLLRLCHERVVSIDTTAAGGNASLMTQLKD